MCMIKKVLKPRLRLGHGLGAILIFILLAIPAYGGIVRPYIIPLYTNTFYRKSADGAFRSSFTDINIQLNGLGFDVSNTKSTCKNGISDSGDAWYHYFGETLECDTKMDTSRPRVTDKFRGKWNSGAPAIMHQLNEHGWVVENHDATRYSLTDLYNDFDQVYTAQVLYSKTLGKFSCTIEFSHGPSATTENSDAYVFESCMRYVSYFGGYID